MKKVLVVFCIVLCALGCNKESSNDEPIVQIHSSLGCVDELTGKIVDIPYATRTYEFMQGISINTNYEDYDLGIYDGESSPIYPWFLESNQFLGISPKNSLEPIKLYELFKQPLKDEIIVNGEEVRVDKHLHCKSKFSNKSTAQTRFFKSIKDSTYTIALFSHDSAYGIGYISVKDSIGLSYLKDVSAGTTTGHGGYYPNLYTLKSKSTGPIFIEIYAIEGQPESDVLTTWVDIRITN